MIEAKETLTGGITSKQIICGAVNTTTEKILPVLEDLEVTPTKAEQTFKTENGDGYENVTVKPIPDEYIIPSGTLDINANGETDVTMFRMARIGVHTPPTLQDKEVTPTKGTQIITSDAEYDGLNEVTVNPIPNEYLVPTLQNKEITIDENGEYIVTFDSGYDGLSQVYVKVAIKENEITGIREYATISSGTRVNLGIIPTNHKVEYCCEWGSNISGVPSLGTYDTTDTNGAKANKYMHFTVFQNKYYWGANTAEYSYGTYQTGKHTIIFNEGSDYKTILDGTVVGTGKSTGIYQLSLFARGANLVNFNGKFYYIKIWDLSTNKLIMHIVPRTNSSNGSELYDLVEKKAIYTGSGVNANGPLLN